MFLAAQQTRAKQIALINIKKGALSNHKTRKKRRINKSPDSIIKKKEKTNIEN